MVQRVNLDDLAPICVGHPWSVSFVLKHAPTRPGGPNGAPYNVTGWTGALTLFANLSATVPETLGLALSVTNGAAGMLTFAANGTQTGGLDPEVRYVYRAMVSDTTGTLYADTNPRLLFTGTVPATRCD